MKKVSMAQIANIVGVSKSTVSNALSGKDNMLSEDTKKHIIEVAKEYGYQKKKHLIRFVIFERRSLSDNKTIDQVPKYQLMYDSIKKECNLYNYKIVVNHIKNKDREKGFGYIQKLLDCDGIIILGWDLTLDDLKWLREFLSIPFVVVDSSFTDPQYDFITNNNHDAAYQLTQKMIDCGHKRIGFIHGGVMNVYTERMNGFENALLANNLEFNQQYVCRVERQDKSEFVVEIRDFLNKLKKRNSPMPTAFIACDDRIAVSFLAASRSLNMEFSLAGFDNLPLCLEQTPQLSSVEPDYRYIGKVAVHRMIEKINFGEKQTLKIYTEPKIYYRDSIINLNTIKKV